MCQRLKLQGQVLHRQFGVGLILQLGQFSQDLAATQSTQHRLPCLRETGDWLSRQRVVILYVTCG